MRAHTRLQAAQIPIALNSEELTFFLASGFSQEPTWFQETFLVNERRLDKWNNLKQLNRSTSPIEVSSLSLWSSQQAPFKTIKLSQSMHQQGMKGTITQPPFSLPIELGEYQHSRPPIGVSLLS